MKKCIAIFVAVLFIAGTAFAGTSGAPAHTNAIWVGGHGQPGTPIQEYILVRNAHGSVKGTSAGISSGDVLIWDTASADGVSVTRDTLGYGFAGVAVTDIATADTPSTVTPQDKNWGYMCIRGYCLALTDTSKSTTGHTLVSNGNTVQGSFMTLNNYTAGVAGGINSSDVGVMLNDVGSDSLSRVWLW